MAEMADTNTGSIAAALESGPGTGTDGLSELRETIARVFGLRDLRPFQEQALRANLPKMNGGR